jgi:hypothetical protein
MLSQKLINFITILQFLNLFTGSKSFRVFSPSHSKLFTQVTLNLLILLFLVLNAIVLYACLLRSHLFVLLIILASKSGICLFSILLLHLWNSLPPELRHFSSHPTSQPNLKSSVFSLYPSVFLKKTQNSSLQITFLTLLILMVLTTFGQISPRLTWLCRFISSSFRCHLSSCHSVLLYVI